MMHAVVVALSRAIVSQLHIRMVLLTVAPFLLSLVVWGIVLWFSLQPMIDWLQQYFAEHDGFRVSGEVLGWLGGSALKTVIVPLIAMWILLPLMILTALVFIGLLAMPTIASHVGRRHFPELERRHGGNIWGSLWVTTVSFVIFVVLWLIAIPLSFIPIIGIVIHPLLWGWLTYRVMVYDALAEYADECERKELVLKHRWPLLAIGTAAGAMGAAPTLLWLGGALSVIFFPLLAAVSIWLYVLVFTFSGLWFQYYCMAALTDHRRVAGGALVPASGA
jgi:hypothetical protein